MTLRQKLFVKKYLERKGNGTQAVLETYDTIDPNVAGVISSENLRKPSIQKEIRQALEAKGLTPESIGGYLKKAIVSGLGNKSTNADSLRGLDLYAKLTGAYDRQDIEQNYKLTLTKMNSKELKLELEKLTKRSNSIINDLNS